MRTRSRRVRDSREGRRTRKYVGLNMIEEEDGGRGGLVVVICEAGRPWTRASLQLVVLPMREAR